MKALLIDLPLWVWAGELVTGGTADDFRDYVKHLIGETPQVGTFSYGHSFMVADKPWFIWVRQAPDPPTLAHEALHIVGGVLEMRGLRWSHDSEEAYAYTLAHIVRAAASPKGWQTIRRGKDF
jgi:hypothetical protein